MFYLFFKNVIKSKCHKRHKNQNNLRIMALQSRYLSMFLWIWKVLPNFFLLLFLLLQSSSGNDGHTASSYSELYWHRRLLRREFRLYETEEKRVVFPLTISVIYYVWQILNLNELQTCFLHFLIKNIIII